ncbi:hypothetical protein [Polyangium jinanense]|uniref:Uncharacterized protein n=1 Tax=Polyangium jinanense TaxID=2829994 RepID=A0A9X4AZQ9_9BACT|nr:hypothetical protein [Polyangium jinanense]MDC3988387.1 hypothetical protein [Polyangium jinanense]
MEHDTTLRFMVSLACDTREFFRWQCPHCGLDFKLKVDADATQDVLASWMSRYLSTQGVKDQDDTESITAPTLTTCPYCGTASERQDFVHPQVAQFIRAFAFREVVEPLVTKMFRDFASGIKSSKHLTVKASFSEARAQRPLSGPEPDDQVVILCLACRQEFTVEESWRGTVACPGCQTVLVPQ